jgi:hypothetical protein
MDHFLQEKHACGYGYQEPIRVLHRLDDFLVQEGLTTLELPRSVVRSWLAKKPHESAATQQQRITPSFVSSRSSFCKLAIRRMCLLANLIVLCYKNPGPQKGQQGSCLASVRASAKRRVGRWIVGYGVRGGFAKPRGRNVDGIVGR